MTARSLWSVRRLCWKPRPTFCSTQSTPSKRVQPSFKTSSRSVIGPSDVCRHLSLVLFYPVMIFCITKPQYKPNCCLRFDLMTFRLIDCPSFLSSYATSVKWDSKGNSSGGFLSTEWTQIDCRNKMLYNWFFPLLTECEMMTAVTFLCQTLTSPTHANDLLAAPGKTVSVRLGTSFLSPEPAVHWSRLMWRYFRTKTWNVRFYVTKQDVVCITKQ